MDEKARLLSKIIGREQYIRALMASRYDLMASRYDLYERTREHTTLCNCDLCKCLRIVLDAIKNRIHASYDIKVV